MDSKRHKPLKWAELISKTLMKQYSAVDIRAESLYTDEYGRHRLRCDQNFKGALWRYNHGLFMAALQKLYGATGNEEFLLYTKSWADSRIDETGYVELKDEIDAIQPGLALFMLYEKFGDKKYLSAIERIMAALKRVPKTSEGGYWHKSTMPNQIWLDGLYMVEPFVIKYGKLKNDSSCYKSAAYQASLMTKYTKDEKTNLLYHGYDELGQEAWADKKTGTSPEFWARALGWYCVALVDILEDMPKETAEYKTLHEMLVSALDAVISYRDKNTGLWYQIIDKGEREDNWIEFSASCLFLYSICKSVRLGLVPEKYLSETDKTYHSLFHFVEIDENGELAVEGTCMGTNVGDYKHYINRKRVTNDFHGVGALVMTLVEFDKRKINLNREE